MDVIWRVDRLTTNQYYMKADTQVAASSFECVDDSSLFITSHNKTSLYSVSLYTVLCNGEGLLLTHLLFILTFVHHTFQNFSSLGPKKYRNRFLWTQVLIFRHPDKVECPLTMAFEINLSQRLKFPSTLKWLTVFSDSKTTDLARRPNTERNTGGWGKEVNLEFRSTRASKYEST